MKAIRILGAAMLALGLTTTGQAGSMQVGPMPAAGGNSLVIKVAEDCHRDARRHFLPEYGRRIWHRHRGSRCRVVRVERPDEDDFDGGRRDCHRDVRSHYLPEYGGRVTHKHVGGSCRVRVYRQYDGGGSGRNCIQIGVVRLCEE
jgi:hypothetical protein